MSRAPPGGLGYGGCSDATNGNFNPSLYGWQTFGGYMVFSDGTPEDGCPNAPVTPLGTLLPTARAFELFSTFVRDGERVLPVTNAGSGAASVRAYAATHGAGTAVVLFNLSETKTLPVRLAVTGMTSASDVTVSTYDKAVYDRSRHGVWARPVTTDHGALSLPTTLSLTPLEHERRHPDAVKRADAPSGAGRKPGGTILAVPAQRPFASALFTSVLGKSLPL